MQTFNQKKIALTVGAALLVMAGTAQAAGTNPTVRTGGIVATGVTTAQAQGLYSATGYAGTITITVYLKPLADTVTAANSQAITDAGVLINGQTGAGGVGSASANNDFTISYNTTTPVYFPVSAVSFTPNTTAGGTALIAANGVNAYAQAAATIAAVAGDTNGAFRMNGANLEYTQDNTATTVVWNVVNVQGLTAGVNPITTNDSAGAAAVTFTSAAAPAVAGVAPDPKLSTHSTATVAGGVKIDGLTINTLTPIASLTKTTNFTVAGVGVATTGCTGSTVVNAKDITAGATGAVAATSLNTILFATPDTVTWTAAPAGDAAAYSTNCFNTGVSGTGVPFAVTLVGGAEPTYSNVVVPASGVAAKMAALPGNATIADGAQVVLVKAESTSPTGTTSLKLTFSEDMSLNGLDDLREVAENVLVGTNSLAALNLNAGGILALTGPVPTAGQDVLTITGVQAADLVGQTLNVNTGIALKEANDTSYSATAAALDTVPQTGPDGVELGGGVAAATGDTAALKAPSATALAVTAATIGIAFGTADTTANAFPGQDPTKVDTIVVSFAAGKEVALNAAAPAKTLADLAANMVVTVNGLVAGNNPVQFQFHPTVAQLALNNTGSALTITLPTALIYSKIDTLKTMKVEYRNATGATTNSSVLVNKNVSGVQAAGSIVVSTADNEPVILPLSATATIDTLITQSIKGTLSVPQAGTALNGSRVKAYLARWEDKPTITTNVTITTGKITNPGDRVATDLAIEFQNKVAVETLIDAQLAAVAAAKAAIPGVANAAKAVAAANIPVYVKLVRSNDTAATGNTTGYQNYLESRAILSATYAGAKGVTGSGDSLDPVYEVMLNPVTGAITGRLTGSIGMTKATTAGTHGLVFINAAGADQTDAHTAGTVAQGVVDATGAFNLLVGVDPQNANLAKIKNGGGFVLLVHEQPGASAATMFTLLTSADSGAANYLPFTPNLVTGLGVRTTVAYDLSKYVKNTVPLENIWAVGGPINPARAAGAAGSITPITFPRMFVGVADNLGNLGGFGEPQNNWNNDGNTGDMALAMVSNKPSVATQLSDDTTLSTFSSASFVNGAVAMAWYNDNDVASAANEHIDVQQSATAVVPKQVALGWSLVTVPTAGLNAATADAVIRVGKGKSQFTWIKATDGAMPALTPGEAVFVFAKPGNL